MKITQHSPCHHPPHFLKNDTIYFLTARTVDKSCYFNLDVKKNIIVGCLNEAIKKYNLNLFAYVILDNHYHLLLEIENSKNLSLFLQIINGKSAFLLNKSENKVGRKIWYNYWDRCIRSERDFWIRFNYIHNNPVKHGYVKNIDRLVSYKFSSYNQWVCKKGKKWLVSCFVKYPIVDFSLSED